MVVRSVVCLQVLEVHGQRRHWALVIGGGGLWFHGDDGFWIKVEGIGGSFCR